MNERERQPDNEKDGMLEKNHFMCSVKQLFFLCVCVEQKLSLQVVTVFNSIWELNVGV